MDKYIETPLTKEKVKELHAGDYVYITGTVYTARDAAHKRMVEQKRTGNGTSAYNERPDCLLFRTYSK